MDDNSIENNCKETITSLIEKYKDNDYMLQRINNHIVTYLPNTLDNELKNYEKRVNRNTYLTNEQQLFIQIFLSKNNFYYLSNNNFFYEYDGEKYLIVKEDDVIHKLLSTISKDRILMQWKYKTKMNVIKLIKDRNLFTSIPETDTIQNVLNVLYPAFFSSKNSAKYFLTSIGDNIFKKNSQVIFLVSQKMKQFLNELDNVAFASIGNSTTTNNFMTKYHENHSYENCRLLKINENFSNNIWRELLKKIGLDLLCVASHYSKRYENSDKFIDNKADEELKNYTYYIKNTTPAVIVNDFCNKYIINGATDCVMEWKNLHFVWKQFLSNSNLPSVIYSNTLKTMFKDRFSYNDDSDSFIGITSKYLPIQSDFIKFWENTITIQDINSEEILFDNELEIDEICYTFKVWSKQSTDHLLSNGNISEENILKILKHFFPSVEIIEDKYVLNITSNMWNKTNDINNSIEYIKDQIKLEQNLTLISFDTAYNYYCNFCHSISSKFIVSKRFFEKFLYHKLSDHIVYEKFFETQSILNL
jgi:hypothetical protein